MIVVKTSGGMTQTQFDALATLLRLRHGASKDAAAQVLVHGQRVGLAAAEVGISQQAVTNAVARCRAGLDLAQVAVTHDSLTSLQKIYGPQTSQLPRSGKATDIYMEAACILDAETRQRVENDGIHLLYLGGWHVMKDQAYLTSGYSTPELALKAYIQGKNLCSLPAASSLAL